ncbi:protein of unknown function [Nitrospina watsonii]|uniref:Uncharacterized protein n=1 Tax=Nitrospina watsonii TaxID=1323948 RepID=A0ABN8VW12_9BACT|nr:protein of unknown function [Nitrospina watsonii]
MVRRVRSSRSTPCLCGCSSWSSSGSVVSLARRKQRKFPQEFLFLRSSNSNQWMGRQSSGWRPVWNANLYLLDLH